MTPRHLAHWCSLWLRTGEKGGSWVSLSITRNCSIKMKRLEPQKARAKLDVAEPEGGKASGLRGQLLVSFVQTDASGSYYKVRGLRKRKPVSRTMIACARDLFQYPPSFTSSQQKH